MRKYIPFAIIILLLLILFNQKPNAPVLDIRYKFLKGEVQRVDSIVYQKKRELVPYKVLVHKVDSFRQIDTAALDGCLVVIDTLLSEINKRDSVIFYQDSLSVVKDNLISHSDSVVQHLSDSVSSLNRKNKSLRLQRNIGIPAAFGIGLAL